jgi:transposase
MTRFTAERRERFLTLLETGRNVEQAAADVDVNPSTVTRWAARGRAGASTEASTFAKRFDAIRSGDGERLTEDDVVRALEQAIRKGSVTANPYLA